MYLSTKESGKCGLELRGHVPTKNSATMQEEEKTYPEAASLPQVTGGNYGKMPCDYSDGFPL